jgi:hypothetical protein
MGTRSIQLRWPGRCWRCSAHLDAGATAEFDPVSRELTCRDCLEGRLPLPLPPVPEPDHPHRPSVSERERIRLLIAETKATLHAARRAS